MKRTLSLLLLLAVCLLAAPASASPTFTMTGSTITGVTGFSGDALTIPATVTGISANAFDDCYGLKYIHFEHNNATVIETTISNDAFDLTSADDLEAVLLNAEVTSKVLSKFKLNSSFKSENILQYIDFSNRSFSNVKQSTQDGYVRFRFDHFIPDGYPEAYLVTRTEAGGESDLFSSKDDYSMFGISNGTVTFTDSGIEPGKSYTYSFAVKSPFGVYPDASRTPYTVSILPESVPEHVLAAIESLPDTGDRAPLLPWLLLLGASVLLLVRKKNAAST